MQLMFLFQMVLFFFRLEIVHLSGGVFLLLLALCVRLGSGLGFLVGIVLLLILFLMHCHLLLILLGILFFLMFCLLDSIVKKLHLVLLLLHLLFSQLFLSSLLCFFVDKRLVVGKPYRRCFVVYGHRPAYFQKLRIAARTS